MSSPYSDLQGLVAERLEGLRADCGMPDLTIATEAKGSVDFEIRQRIEQASVGVVVMTPEWQAVDDHPDARAVTVLVHLIWKTTVAGGTKGTRLPPTDLLAHIESYLHSWSPSDGWSPMEFQQASMLSVDEPPGVIVWSSRYQTTAMMSVTD